MGRLIRVMYSHNSLLWSRTTVIEPQNGLRSNGRSPCRAVLVDVVGNRVRVGAAVRSRGVLHHAAPQPDHGSRTAAHRANMQPVEVGLSHIGAKGLVFFVESIWTSFSLV